MLLASSSERSSKCSRSTPPSATTKTTYSCVVKVESEIQDAQLVPAERERNYVERKLVKVDLVGLCTDATGTSHRSITFRNTVLGMADSQPRRLLRLDHR